MPTLVAHRAGDDPAKLAGSRYVADRLAGARLRGLEGADHAISADETEPVLAALDRFSADAWEFASSEEADRVLATVLLTDIVGSTEKLAELGDRRWRELLLRHHDAIRRQLSARRCGSGTGS